MRKSFFFLFILLSSCYKEDFNFIAPVNDFEISKYLGRWHEIARTDNTFERGCEKVTAQYTIRNDGGIDVINSCIKNERQKQAKGRAYFKNSSDIGSLKVTFFWPFYGNYNIIYIDESYSNAIVYGGSPKYIWILSRSETITKIQLEYLLTKIDEFGLDSKSLLISDSIK